MGRDRNCEFIKKFVKAKEMEAEAFMELLPEGSREHMSIIRREVSAMIREGAADIMHRKESHDTKKEEGRDKKNVRKVEIG